MAKNFYGFEKKSSRAVTALEIIVICILVLLIAVILAFNLLFRSDGTAPTMFGYQVYLNQSSTMGDAVPKGSAVFASTDISGLKRKDVVLVKITAAGKDYTAILRIQDMQNQDGVNYYLLKGDASPATEAVLVPESSVIARAEKLNKQLGSVLMFATSKLGIITAIVIPCVLIILLQIFKIIKVNRMEEEEALEEAEAEIELDDSEEVVFSTLREAAAEPKKDPLPLRKMYVNEEGEADFRRKPAPTAEPADFERSLKSPLPLRSTAGASGPSAQAKINSISSHFSQKPAAKKPEAYSVPAAPLPPVERKPEPAVYERPVEAVAPEAPAPAYTPERAAEPKNAAIPAEAVKPRETIAPPPKQANNKTLEELMRVIDRAQSDLKK